LLFYGIIIAEKWHFRLVERFRLDTTVVLAQRRKIHDWLSGSRSYKIQITWI